MNCYLKKKTYNISFSHFLFIIPVFFLRVVISSYVYIASNQSIPKEGSKSIDDLLDIWSPSLFVKFLSLAFPSSHNLNDLLFAEDTLQTRKLCLWYYFRVRSHQLSRLIPNVPKCHRISPFNHIIIFRGRDSFCLSRPGHQCIFNSKKLTFAWTCLRRRKKYLVNLQAPHIRGHSAFAMCAPYVSSFSPRTLPNNYEEKMFAQVALT